MAVEALLAAKYVQMNGKNPTYKTVGFFISDDENHIIKVQSNKRTLCDDQITKLK